MKLRLRLYMLLVAAIVIVMAGCSGGGDGVASGFARAATFSTNFKKKFALTPNQFRERVQSV